MRVFLFLFYIPFVACGYRKLTHNKRRFIEQICLDDPKENYSHVAYKLTWKITPEYHYKFGTVEKIILEMKKQTLVIPWVNLIHEADPHKNDEQPVQNGTLRMVRTNDTFCVDLYCASNAEENAPIEMYYEFKVYWL